ncbi:hypothetical protein ABEG17_15370 [Pedococcus sp. KACC 23699]|uniref:Uncharacterized protein n=1 Tax=Pedococcus sp. KACC 23699 TaxID=3149228 RepID=A0AAU7JRW5_9MICO
MALAILAAIALQLRLPDRYGLQRRWLPPVLELVLLGVLTAINPVRLKPATRFGRIASVAIVAAITIDNGIAAGSLDLHILRGTTGQDALGQVAPCRAPLRSPLQQVSGATLTPRRVGGAARARIPMMGTRPHPGHSLVLAGHEGRCWVHGLRLATAAERSRARWSLPCLSGVANATHAVAQVVEAARFVGVRNRLTLPSGHGRSRARFA